MKPAPFAYHRPRDVGEALALLGGLGDDTKVLAGGQSLVPMLNFRLARPVALVDVGDLDELRFVRRTDTGLRIGSLVTHRALETEVELPPEFRVLRRTASLIGHYPIRVRGTVGGSLAHGDAAAEWCLLAVVLQAAITVASMRGRRTIAATEFFRGTLETALAPDELIVEIEFPTPTRQVEVAEITRRSGDFAVVAAAVRLDVRDRRIRSASLGLGGVADTVVRVPEAERVLIGAGRGDAHGAFQEAAHVACQQISPPSDLQGSAEYRRRLARVLTVRSLQASLRSRS